MLIHRRIDFLSLKNKFSIVFFLFLLGLALPSWAFIGVIEPVAQPMNKVNGYIVVCPPDDGIKERVLESVDIFFEKYNFADDITDFVTDIKDFDDVNGGYGPCVTCGADFEQRTFQQVMTDPRFDDFAKIVKLYPDYLGKTIFYNLTNLTTRNEAKTLPKCVFENDNYISGGLKVEVQGLKGDSDSKNNQYYLMEKGVDLTQYKMPFASNFLYDGDDIYQAYRVLKNKIFSLSLNLGSDYSSSSRAGNNFLQIALKDGSTKKTKLACRDCSMQVMLSRFTQCNEDLHEIGFCNKQIYNSRYLEASYINEAFAKNHLDATDPIVLESAPLDFYIHTAKIEKTGGSQPSAKILFAGRLREKGYRGARIFGQFVLEQGKNLSTDLSERYPLTVEEMSDSEKEYFQKGIATANLELSSENSPGIDPNISLTLNYTGMNDIYFRSGVADKGFDIYRNQDLVAHVDGNVFEFTDTQLNSDSSLPSGLYSYAVIPINSGGEYFLPENWFTNSSGIDFVKVRKY